MNDKMAKIAADKRIKTMITSSKINTWKAKIEKLLNPKFDGSMNINILPVSEDPLSEVISDICRQASTVAAGLYLEDLINLCNPKYVRSPANSGHDLFIPGLVGVDVKMSTETVKKGDKKKVSQSLNLKCIEFKECFWVEFYGKAKTEEIEGVMWYSGADAHEKLGLTSEHVTWISQKVISFRKMSFSAIKDALK